MKKHEAVYHDFEYQIISPGPEVKSMNPTRGHAHVDQMTVKMTVMKLSESIMEDGGVGDEDGDGFDC